MDGRANVLLVDDEESVLITMEALLAREGYQVATAGSVATAIPLAEQRRFDAAILDLHLDDGDGLDILEALRSQQPECSVIILTGFASIESTLAAIQQGAYDYLMKPCDLTELKLTMERAVERATLARAARLRTEELELRVEQATKELGAKVDELSQANRALREASEVRDRALADLERMAKSREEFLAAAAHDMRNPLTLIKGFSQFARRQAGRLALPEGHPLPQALEEVDESADQLGGLIDEFMDVTRLQAGQEIGLQTGPTDLVAMTQRAASYHQRTTERHRIEVTSSAARLVGDWDGRRLERVLSNLLSNAIKYSPGGGDIDIVLLSEESGSIPWAVLSVRDQGLGIAAKDIDRVFEQFARGDNVTGIIPGVGIGLASARRIVEQHGGMIAAESVEGKGSVFTVRLPLISADLLSPVSAVTTPFAVQIGS